MTGDADSKTQEHRFAYPDISILTRANQAEVTEMWQKHVSDVLEAVEPPDRYTVIGLLDDHRPIGTYELNRIFNALKEAADSEMPLLLILVSSGGSVEAAYQIAKLCRKYSNGRFVVAVPRLAKSAATLLCLGADEIHMGELGQLGPIDLQLGGVPAIAVRQALSVLSSLVVDRPQCAPLFSDYLQRVLSVEQIGYSDRVAESVEQYAARLLANRKDLPHTLEVVTSKLAQAYKNHRFVIDEDEARSLLGSNMVKSNTPEAQLAEKVYEYFDFFNLFLRDSQFFLHVTGEISKGSTLFPL